LVLALVLVLSAIAGVGGWWLAVGRYTHAPSVLRLTYAQAADRLDNAGLHAQRGSEVYSSAIAPGRVVSQDPGGGDRVHRGATVTLHLSRGPETAVVPDVSGKKVSVAVAALRRANLRVSGRNESYSTLVPAGRVIRTDPPAGRTIHTDRGVQLVVSKGPRPVDVPDVTGKSYGDAASVLSAVHLKPREQQVYSDTVPDGKVISTTPAAGTTAHEGQTVIVNVSKGPHLVQVPDVVGESLDQAKAALARAGFVADVRQLPGGPNTVLRQSPPGGSMERRGTTVVLYVF
jgi:serine/threonine-protein kinase